MLKRIAEDRKSLQEKIQTSAVTETSPPSGQGQKLGGKILTNVDNNCILMVRPRRSFNLHACEPDQVTKPIFYSCLHVLLMCVAADSAAVW